MSSVPGDFDYVTGSYKAFVPQFLPDTVVIRPYGEYGMYGGGAYTLLGGGYWVNANSFATDPSSGPMADIVYLVQNDLALLPNVKRVLLAIYWYTSLDYGNTSWGITVGPTIGPEVQAWNWSGGGPPMWQAGPWNRSNAYWLQANHKVWPSPADAAFIEGIQYLESAGYQVGILPINSFISRNIYVANTGESEVDRSARTWTDNNALASYLSSYQAFIQHYVDLCAANDLRPWLFSIGSGLRDLTSIPDDKVLYPQVISTLQSILKYCKGQLPNTQTAYFADIDEYYYHFEVIYKPNRLDALWTTPELDVIGVNWFAPLALDDTEDISTLVTNVFRGEGYDFYLPTVYWRSTQQLPDRVITATTNTFKTGLTQTTLTPRYNGVKAIEDWLVFSHYTPVIPGFLVGCTPPPAICRGDPKVCTAFQGTGTVVTEQPPVMPSVGGIAPAPSLQESYLQVGLTDYCVAATPANIPDDSTLAFTFDFALDAINSSSTQSYRLITTDFGLSVDVINQVVTLQLPQSDGSFISKQLFTLWAGEIEIIYTPTSVSISVDQSFDTVVTPTFNMRLLTGVTFKMPQVNQMITIGNPATLPIGYSAWEGRVYYLKFILGQGDNLSGGEFYFEDAYNGIRTAWQAPVKPWIAITGYGSLHGTGADPFTRPEVIQWSGGANIPASYPDAMNLNAAVFWNNWHAVNIRGPYGSNFDPDEVYQANMLYAATFGLEPAGPQHIAAWFFDTRSPAAHLVKMPSTGWQVYNDAYDGEIDCSLNGKAAVRSSGINLQYTPRLTVDQMLGLSSMPGPIPPQRSIIAEPGVPQQ